jgi:hypothetical protein
MGRRFVGSVFGLGLALAACATSGAAPRSARVELAPAPPPARYGHDPPAPPRDVGVPPASCAEANEGPGLPAISSDARTCYARALKLDPRRRGRVELALALDGSGRARARIASSTMNDAPLEHCLVSAAERRTWPCVTSDVTIVLELVPPVTTTP